MAFPYLHRRISKPEKSAIDMESLELEMDWFHEVDLELEVNFFIPFILNFSYSLL